MKIEAPNRHELVFGKQPPAPIAPCLEVKDEANDVVIVHKGNLKLFGQLLALRSL